MSFLTFSLFLQKFVFQRYKSQLKIYHLFLLLTSQQEQTYPKTARLVMGLTRASDWPAIACRTSYAPSIGMKLTYVDLGFAASPLLYILCCFSFSHSVRCASCRPAYRRMASSRDRSPPAPAAESADPTMTLP
jgi:hypothetical protein